MLFVADGVLSLQMHHSYLCHHCTSRSTVCLPASVLIWCLSPDFSLLMRTADIRATLIQYDLIIT
jgi:hypothetical protein